VTLMYSGSEAIKLKAHLDAADALAEKAEQLLEHIRRGWAHGDEFNALVAAVFKYREVSK